MNQQYIMEKMKGLLEEKLHIPVSINTYVEFDDKKPFVIITDKESGTQKKILFDVVIELNGEFSIYNIVSETYSSNRKF